MLLRNIYKRKEYIFCVLFSGYIAAVLWITLFSRVGNGYRSFLWPFHSYVEILKGDGQFFFENIGNVCLFIPLGIILKCIEVEGIKRVVLVGFLTSLFIELLQAIFALGTFESDDLIHNTFGVVVGYWVVKKFDGEFRIKLSSQMKGIILLSIFLFSVVPFACGEIKHQKMVRLAELFDREDGTKNLLILNGKNGNAWDTDVHIKYLDDGSIHIKGTSNKRSWWQIGEITLEPGVYAFSGLSGMENETVGLELETDNHRFAPDVGPVDEVKFALDKTTKLMVYVSVYDGCDCDVVARPVIYKEG